MTLRLTRWRQRPGRAIPLVLAFALIAAPVAASETAPAPKAKGGQPSLHQAAAREAARMSLSGTKEARRAEQASTSKQSTSFFKTKPGAVALAVMVLGSGYAIYSASHDRITSPAKK